MNATLLQLYMDFVKHSGRLHRDRDWLVLVLEPAFKCYLGQLKYEDSPIANADRLLYRYTMI